MEESLLQKLAREKEALGKMDLSDPDILEQSRKVDKLVLETMKALNEAWIAVREAERSGAGGSPRKGSENQNL